MRNKHSIDFDKINSIDDFYDQLTNELSLPDYFGRNTDALWDVLTGEIELPIEVHFTNINSQQLKDFGDIINVFDEAAMEMPDEFEFEYHYKPSPEDEDDDDEDWG